MIKLNQNEIKLENEIRINLENLKNKEIKMKSMNEVLSI